MAYAFTSPTSDHKTKKYGSDRTFESYEYRRR
ncbi:uncharacterized protein G2W53_042677 [Senna tora]|uniref:Uncharacterized protein n=1 Tax=Senna tora TaxID=362788 RepID=A0A834SHB4_9FABA|nr:uncharacterized protein G2W53_042677 [Senna tora]